RLFPDVGKNVAPQSGLPALVRLQKMRPPPAAELILACPPVGQPIGPVPLILVEKVGQALSELITRAQISVTGEETDQRLIDIRIRQRAQQAHEPPCQGLFVKGGRWWSLVSTKHTAI